LDIWGGSPPESVEEAINRIAALLYTRTYIQGQLSAIPSNPSLFVLPNAAGNDAFLVKYAADGTPTWVRRIGGTGVDQGMGVSADTSGNVYVTGYATGAATVFAADGITAAFSLGTAGQSDAFLVKYAADGTPTWVRRIGGTGADQGLGVSADVSENVYVTGYATGAATVFAADGTTTAFSLGTAGSSDAFLVKYAANGTPTWVRRIGGTGVDQGLGVSADTSGNVYVTGYATGAATVFAADGTTTAFSLGTAGDGDAFLVKYAADGTPTWVRRIGGTGVDQGLGVSADVSGNVYVTGYTGGTATVFAANGTTTAFSLGNAGQSDAFVVKYAADGTPTWVRRIGGTGVEQGMGVSADVSGNVYVTGYVFGTATVATVFAADGTTTAFSLGNTGQSDAFVVKYAADGTPTWVRRIGGTTGDQGMGVSADVSGNVYVTGFATGAAVVFAADGITTAFYLGTAGSSDAFVVKYAADGTPTWLRRIGGATVDQGMGVSADVSGNVYVTGYTTGTALISNI
jgi:hypothetical protein